MISFLGGYASGARTTVWIAAMMRLRVCSVTALAAVVLAAPVQAEFSYITSYGTFGSGTGQFNGPTGVAFGNGLVYVADFANNRIDVFNPSNFAGTFTTYGSLSSGAGAGKFDSPRGVAVSGGLVYVADSVNNRIVTFDPSNFAGTFTSYGSLGSGLGQFDSPADVAVANGLVYVSDTINNRIDVFNPSNFAGTFTSYGSLGSGPGQFSHPAGLAFDAQGNLLVTDIDNNRIVLLSVGTAVPEPSSLVLGFLAISSLGFFACARRLSP